MGMVVPFPEPERSWRASLLIFLVDCWSKKSASSSSSRGTVSSSIWALFRLLDMLSLRLPLAHLAQSIARQSSPYKYMQNTQVLSRDQTPKQALIVQFWRWVWLSPSPSLNGPDEPSCWSSWWTAGRKNHHQARDTASSSICALSRLLDLLSLRLSLAHLAQSMALKSSPCKDMQNSQVLSWKQAPKQALILQFWQWVWLSSSPSLNRPDEPPCWSSWWTAGRQNPHHHWARDSVSSSIWPLPTSRLALLASLNGTPHPIHGPPILSLQRYAKLTSVVTRTNTQTSLDSTVLAMSTVVPFPEPQRSWRAS